MPPPADIEEQRVTGLDVALFHTLLGQRGAHVGKRDLVFFRQRGDALDAARSM